MSDTLLRAIERVQSEIEHYESAVQKNEYQTVQSLINPVLNALGWRVNEVARVRQQYRVGRGKVDMALMHDNKPVILIEAKALRTHLGEDEIEQLIGYCIRCDAETAILTNGAEWRVYRPWLRNLSFEQRLLFRLHLDKDNATDSAKQLGKLGIEAINNLQDSDLEILAGSYWNSQARSDLLRPFTDILLNSFASWSGMDPADIPREELKESLHNRLFELHIPLEPDIQPPPPPPPPTPPPRHSRIVAIELNGQRFQVTYVRDVLVNTAEWLVKNGRLQRNSCPVRLGRGQRYLVHTTANHPNGSPFAGPKHLSNGLFLEANFSARDIIRHSYALLEQFNFRPAKNTLRIIEE